MRRVTPSDPEEQVRRDAETRSRAQREFEGAFVVEAGAGTGKTSILVARVVAWVLGPGWERNAQSLTGGAVPPSDEEIAREVLSRVCAITFTEAAAAEMERRVAEALRKLVAGKTPTGVEFDALPPEATRKVRAERLGEALEHLVVRTIHAFCRRILARHPLEAGLHPGFQVDADARAQREVVREVVERAVSEGYDAPEDRTLLELAADDVGPAELESALLVLLADGVDAGRFAAEPHSPERVGGFLAAVREAVEAFEAADAGRLAGAPQRGKLTHIALAAIAGLRDGLPSSAVDAAGLQELADDQRDALDEAKDRIQAWARGTFNAGETEQLGAAMESVQHAAARLAPLVDAMRALEPLRLERARRALAPLLEQATELLRTRGFVTYAQLLNGAARVLSTDARVCARMRAGIDQLLVDEFQDTDPLQCEIVARLALSGEPGTGPGLFLVGDPKQSIYGWRSADLGAYDTFVGRVQPEPETRGRLAQNFRSVPAVLAEVERAIAPVMRAEPGLQPEFQGLVAAGDIRNEGPPAQRAAVEYWVSWEWSDEDGPVAKTSAGRAAALEARALARDLAELHRDHGVAWREMGILLRGMGELDVYLSALRESDIPYDVERERTYYQRREIVEAAAWLQTVLDPLDGLSLVTTLRSAAVGVPDAALVALWDAKIFERVAALREPDEAAFAELDAMIERARLALPGDVPGLDRVEGWDGCLRAFVRVLAELRRSHASQPLDTFIEKLRALSLLEVGEASRFLGAYRLANLDRLFRELEAELERGGDAQALLRRLRTGIAQAEEAESARPTEAADDAVRVMTIHKAKGLDFEHTYVVQLHKRPGGAGAEPGTVPFERFDDHDEYVLFGAPTLGRHAVKARNRRVEAAERVRTLYVAATRAKRRLVLLGTWPEAAPDEPPEPEHAKSYIDLLASRAGGRPDLVAHMTRAHDEGVLHHDGEDGVRWVFPGLVPEEAASPSVAAEAEAGEAGAGVRERARALDERRQRADAVMERPYRAAASDDGHAGEREEQAEKRFSGPGGTTPPFEGVEREAARVAGTVVHRVLEELDLEGEPVAALASQRELLPKRVAGLAGEAAAPRALAKAASILEALEASGEPGLLGRLRELRQHIVARELDVLLAPSSDDEGPVGFVAGAIDLVYRDPDDGRFVVADYKTDAIADEADADAKARRYEGQGRAYQLALREALDLPYTPRFELWFLSAGMIRRL